MGVVFRTAARSSNPSVDPYWVNRNWVSANVPEVTSDDCISDLQEIAGVA
jgi:hypothetical protein